LKWRPQEVLRSRDQQPHLNLSDKRENCIGTLSAGGVRLLQDDLHMVLQGISGDTMIAEVPKPDRAFVAEGSPWFDAVKQVRGKIADRFGQTFAQTPFTQLNAKFAKPAAPLTMAPASPPAAPAGGPAAPLLTEPPDGDIFDALPPFKAKVPQTPVTITGVGFFDRVHDQTGVAMKNGIELHPVLAIEFR
jgi:hypothetical protein